MDPREREHIVADLDHADEEVRRLAVERLTLLPPHERMPALVERLGDPSWRVRKAAIERLAASPEVASAVRALVASLADGENSGRRNAAVEALIRCGAPAVPHLLEASRDPDGDVRKLVVDVLAGIADASSAERLVALLVDEDPNVRGAAADALGAQRATAAAPALLACAQGDAEPIVRLSALRALAALGQCPSVEELGSALSHPLLRPAAYALLGASDDPASLEVLAKGLESPSRMTREAAIGALVERVAAAEPAEAPRLASTLRERFCDEAALADLHERVAEAATPGRLALVQFLGLLARAGSTAALLAAGTDEALADAALTSLAQIGDAAAAEIERRWLDLDGDARVVACAALARIGDERALARLRSALAAPDPELRAAAASALGECGDASALADLVEAMVRCEDDDPDGSDAHEARALTQAAIAIAARAHASVGALIAQLETRLAGGGECFRTCAARVLAAVARPQDASLLALLLADPADGVRRQAIEGLPRLGAEGAELLRLALADEAPGVRIAAARALALSGGPDGLADLARLASDPDPRAREAALRAVATWWAAQPAPEAAEPALALLREGLARGGAHAVAALEALSRIGGDASVELAIGALADPEPEVVQNALACIAAHASDARLGVLAPLLSHPHWAVRTSAAQVAARRGWLRGVPELARRLEQERDEFVRDALLRALAALETRAG